MSEEKNVTLEQDVLVEKEVVNAPAEPVTEAESSEAAPTEVAPTEVAPAESAPRNWPASRTMPSWRTTRTIEGASCLPPRATLGIGFCCLLAFLWRGQP